MNYDPDAPEGDKPKKSQYVSRKDFVWIGGILVVMAIAFYPIWKRLEADGQKKICGTNIQQVAKAMQQYASLNDDRYPPVFDEDEDQAPLLQAGYPLVWASRLVEFMPARASFGCPAATPEEHCQFYSSKKQGADRLAYGMYRAAAGKAEYQISSKENVVLLAETNNSRAGSPYNPVPFVLRGGVRLENDGFLIGWDNRLGNMMPDRSTKYVTRLAFRNAEQGYEWDKVSGRHDVGVMVMFVDGHRKNIQPSAARVDLLGDRPTAFWRLD